MQLDQSLSILQRYLTRMWNADALIHESGELSYSEFEYLSILNNCMGDECDMVDNDGPHLSVLAEKMQLRKASVSSMVRKLEKKGLVERVQCRYDARAQHVLLTKEGEALLQHAQQIYDRAAARIRQELDEAGYQALEHALGKVCAQLQTGNDAK